VRLEELKGVWICCFYSWDIGDGVGGRHRAVFSVLGGYFGDDDSVYSAGSNRLVRLMVPWSLLSLGILGNVMRV
jgi:hypothetical protein